MISRPALLTSPRQTVEYFDAFLARANLSETRRMAVQFGPTVIAVNLCGFADNVAYGATLKPSMSRLADAFAIHAIAGAACSLARPRLAWKPSDFGRKRTVRGWSDAQRTTYLLPEERGLAIADWESRNAFVWIPDYDALPWYERIAPFRWLFDDLALRLGLTTVHAAAVGIDGKGVLIVGRGGVGKSTLALACLGRGFDYVSDDYCLLSQTAGIVAYGLYTSAKWKVDAKLVPEWLTSVPPDAVDKAEQKNILFVDKALPARLVDRLSIKALIVPALGDCSRAVLDNLAMPTALRHLAASTLAQSEAASEQLVRDLSHVVRSVPAYRLSMPPDTDACVDAIQTLLETQLE